MIFTQKYCVEISDIYRKFQLTQNQSKSSQSKPQIDIAFFLSQNLFTSLFLFYASK